MRKITRFFAFCLFVFSTISCSSTKLLQKSLNYYKTPLGYQLDSRVSLYPKTDSLAIIYNGINLDMATVSKKGVKVFPFLFVNYFESKFLVKLGWNYLEQNYNDFFFDSMLDESKRSGSYALRYDKTPNDSAYTLEITMDTCVTTAKYRQSTVFLYFIWAYSTSYSEEGFPAKTSLGCTASLRKGEKIFYKKYYTFNKELPFINNGENGTDGLRANLTVNMVDALSLCTKQIIESIVNDVNSSIGKSNFKQ